MSKPRRRSPPPRSSPALPPTPPAMTDAEIRQLISDEFDKRFPIPIDEKGPGTTLNTVTEMPGGVKLEPVCPACGNGARQRRCLVCNPPAGAAPSATGIHHGLSNLPTSEMTAQVEPHGRNAPTAYSAAGETRSTNVTPTPVKGFKPSDIEAALRRSPAFKEAPPSQAQIAEEAETTSAASPPSAPEAQKDAEEESAPVAAESPSSVAAARFPSPRLKAFVEVLFWAALAPLAAVLLGFMADVAVAAAIEFWPVAHAVAEGFMSLINGS